MESLISIGNNNLKCGLDLVNGLSFKYLYVRSKDWLELMPDCTKDGSKLTHCNFLMFPYSNRIKNGEFTFLGKKYRLRNGENHAIHGDVRKRKWRIKSIDSNRVSAIFDSRDYDDINWPWSFYLELEYAIDGNKLISLLKAKNISSSKFPIGTGWHPYFKRELSKGDKVYLKIHFESYYPDNNGDCIPIDFPKKLIDLYEFKSEKILDRDSAIDCCFGGYNGNGYIYWDKSDVKLDYSCSTQFRHLIIYNPDEEFFAVEPVTNANNGINWMDKDEFNHGMIILDPQEEITFSFIMKFTI